MNEKRLWNEVILVSVEDIVNAASISRAAYKKLAKRESCLIPSQSKAMEAYRNKVSAISWIKSKERATGSFVWACEMCDFDPDILRRAIEKKIASLPVFYD